MKPCIYCAKPLPDDALECRHCHYDQPPRLLSEQFQCTNCGSALPYTGLEKVVKCKVCGSSGVVPPALREWMDLHSPRIVKRSPPQQVWDWFQSRSNWFWLSSIALLFLVIFSCILAQAL
jgi:hypothetical protein